ncbi:hypothetical protein F4802DRAFT_234929 [Xylaria palmicola]|nr:hypothetical protein F4802DRAFT_234929 [Xylaria palmicola]
MYGTKVFVSLAALAVASTAQEFPDPACSSSIAAILAAVPTPGPELSDYLGQVMDGIPGPDNLLAHPDEYVSGLCSAVAELPPVALEEFADYGASLLSFASVEISSYDGIVTKCVATGAEGASITSFIHSIASTPEGLCAPTSTPSTPSGGNGTATITSFPTPTGNSTTPSIGVPSQSVPTAGAARPTSALFGAAAMGGLFGAVALL